jgi:hypothetical protein
VTKLDGYYLARNLDWCVTKEAVELGGNERLCASAIVRRDPGYFVRNFIVVIFVLTTSGFAAFMCPPSDFGGRSGIILTVLLSAVAFKYGGDELIPLVPYPTILDSYVLFNIYIILGLGAVAFFFSTLCGLGGANKATVLMTDWACSLKPGNVYKMRWIQPYDPMVELAICFALAILWFTFNAVYWRRVHLRMQFNLKVVDDAELGWVVFKTSGSGPEGRFDSERLLTLERKVRNRTDVAAMDES